MNRPKNMKTHNNAIGGVRKIGHTILVNNGE